MNSSSLNDDQWIFIEGKAKALAEASLQGININLDSLKPDNFNKMARRNYFSRMLEGIHAAESANLNPMKINVVVIKGYIDDEIEDLAGLCHIKPYKVRFIEFMPPRRRVHREKRVGGNKGSNFRESKPSG